MAATGTLTLSLQDVTQAPIVDSVEVRFRRGSDGKYLDDPIEVAFTPAKTSQDFSLPAFPDEFSLVCSVRPDRYRARFTPSFALTDGETVKRNPTVLRTPSKWSPQFTAWADLPPSFTAFQQVLGVSPNVRLLTKTASTPLGPLVEDGYDRTLSQAGQLAKTAMLNLYAKLTGLKEPVQNRRPWFSFVKRILAIGQERFIAIADPALESIVRKTREKGLGDYKKSPVGDHPANFLKGAADYNPLKTGMVSVKSPENKANLQLTLAHGTDPITGEDVLLLDTDIDEDGELFKHILDALIVHRITGGTHPFDVHELLLLADKTLDLGYSLV